MQYNILFLSPLAVFWRKKRENRGINAPVFMSFKKNYIKRQAFHESYKFFFRRRI